MLANFVGIGRGPVNIDAHIAADGPPQLCERLQECRQPNLNLCIICGCGKKHADASHPLILLGACRDRPSGGSASKNEFTPSHYRPQAQWIVAFETRSLKGVMRTCTLLAKANTAYLFDHLDYARAKPECVYECTLPPQAFCVAARSRSMKVTNSFAISVNSWSFPVSSGSVSD